MEQVGQRGWVGWLGGPMCVRGPADLGLGAGEAWVEHKAVGAEVGARAVSGEVVEDVGQGGLVARGRGGGSRPLLRMLAGGAI